MTKLVLERKREQGSKPISFKSTYIDLDGF